MGEGAQPAPIFIRAAVILYSSDYPGGKRMSAAAGFSKGYVWAVYPSFDIFTAKPAARSNRLTKTPVTMPETTITRDGKTSRIHIYTRRRPRTSIR